MIGLLYFTMVLAMAWIMLHLGIGPFGHQKFLHWHQGYLTLPRAVRTVALGICAIIAILAISHLLGLYELPKQAPVSN